MWLTVPQMSRKMYIYGYFEIRKKQEDIFDSLNGKVNNLYENEYNE